MIKQIYIFLTLILFANLQLILKINTFINKFICSSFISSSFHAFGLSRWSQETWASDADLWWKDARIIIILNFQFSQRIFIILILIWESIFNYFYAWFEFIAFLDVFIQFFKFLSEFWFFFSSFILIRLKLFFLLIYLIL